MSVREISKIILTIVAGVLIFYSWTFVPQIVRGTLFSDLGLILWGVMSFIILWGAQKLDR